MIQESINQILNTAAIGYRLTPAYAKRQEASDIVGKYQSASSLPDAKDKYGLAEIEENLKNPEKQYGKTELKDIESRVSELNKNIYSAKLINTPGHPLYKYANKLMEKNKTGITQQDYHKMLSSIESNLEKRKAGEALQSMESKATAAIEQDNNFKNLRDKVLNRLKTTSLRNKSNSLALEQIVPNSKEE